MGPLVFRSARRCGWLLAVLIACALPVAAQPVADADLTGKLRIALVPLDDRPVCLQYPQMMAPLAHAQIIAPPTEHLGRFTSPGDTDAIARWLRAQDWSRIDALIVSVDMLAYGGLVASRVHGVDQATALARLAVLDEIAEAHPRLPVYAFSTLMRLAPTADRVNEAYREKLARWAEIADDAQPGAEQQELAGLVAAIPPAALADYRRARARNRAVNLASVQRVASGVIDYLVVSQDDAKPRGVHLADRKAVTAAASQGDLAGRVGIQPGADEVAMLLLSRAVLRARNLQLSMRVTYSSEAARTMVAPFEDRQLHETVAFQIVAAGAGPARMDDPDDLHLYVFASRHDAGEPRRFAADVVKAVAAGTRVIVADVDPKGDVQGGSPAFTDALLADRLFPKLYGYASWNTAGNTLGTVIPHGLLVAAGTWLAARCASPEWAVIADAQATFMLHRLLNDYAYQGVLRPRLNAELREAKRTPLWLADNAREVASRIQQDLAPKLATYAEPFTSAPYTLRAYPRPGQAVGAAPSATTGARATLQTRPSDVPDITVRLGAPRDLRVTLPWARTFEATITFEVPVEEHGRAGDMAPPTRLPACPATK